ncbi:tektin-1-like [Sinocyclocheilus grahami]|uniref:tektin-1-like n=1 Tax=Sinocyclocheilus grahami TaxID=75366 RepID=UPI0007ACB8B1|nr:PREDICTED: tektin-1-like [Sinocyclocheilus grahami]
MSGLMGSPDKFLPSEWKHANQVHFRSSEAERSLSQRLTAECQRLVEESDKSTKHMQQDAQKKLEQRIQDIKFWRQELDQKFEEMVQEIETLIIFKSRVERALESCSEPFQVTLQCLTVRQKRVAIDLVHDEVEEELLKEKEVIEGVMVLLQRTLEQINEQIRLIRSVKYYLEKDLQDKFQAEHIDDFCALLTNASPDLNKGNSDFSSVGTAVTLVESPNNVTAPKEKHTAPVRLTEALKLSEMELKALARRQLSLEEEIQVKTNSLYIDEVICHQLRQPVVIHNF